MNCSNDGDGAEGLELGCGGLIGDTILCVPTSVVFGALGLLGVVEAVICCCVDELAFLGAFVPAALELLDADGWLGLRRAAIDGMTTSSPTTLLIATHRTRSYGTDAGKGTAIVCVVAEHCVKR